MVSERVQYFVRQAGIEKGPMDLLELRRTILANGNDHFLVRSANESEWNEANELEVLADLYTPLDTSNLSTKRETPSSKR